MARTHKHGSGSRWEEDNRLHVNPWPFVVIAVIIGAIVGLGVLLSALD